MGYEKPRSDSIPTVDISSTSSTIDILKNDSHSASYDPAKNRHVTHPTSTLGSFFHLLKSSLGSGLLAMPAAFKHVGVIPGCIGTVLVAVIATHCVHVLVQTSREISRISQIAPLSYTDTCELSFRYGPKKLRSLSKSIRYFADYAMAGVCLGGTSVYVVFVASSLKNICDEFFTTNYSVEIYCGLILIPLVLITQIRYLKFIVPFSIFANVCLLLTFGITCYYVLDLQSPEYQLTAPVKGWPLFISTAIFAMEGINVVMPIENEMANPEHFLGCPGILNITMTLVATLYGLVGLFGYLKYGDGVLGSITLNLPQDELPAIIAKVLVAIAVFFTYCLQMYAPMDILWTRLKGKIKPQFHNIAQVLLRTASVCLTVSLAVAVPDLELLIGVVGAIFFSTLGLFIPILVETVHKWDRGLGPYKIVLWKNVILLICYLIVLCSGCYASLSEILAKYIS